MVSVPFSLKRLPPVDYIVQSSLEIYRFCMSRKCWIRGVIGFISGDCYFSWLARMRRGGQTLKPSVCQLLLFWRQDKCSWLKWWIDGLSWPVVKTAWASFLVSDFTSTDLCHIYGFMGLWVYGLCIWVYGFMGMLPSPKMRIQNRPKHFCRFLPNQSKPDGIAEKFLIYLSDFCFRVKMTWKDDSMN